MVCKKYSLIINELLLSPEKPIPQDWIEHTQECRFCAKNLQNIELDRKINQTLTLHFAAEKKFLQSNVHFPKEKIKAIEQQFGLQIDNKQPKETFSIVKKINTEKSKQESPTPSTNDKLLHSKRQEDLSKQTSPDAQEKSHNNFLLNNSFLDIIKYLRSVILSPRLLPAYGLIVVALFFITRPDKIFFSPNITMEKSKMISQANLKKTDSSLHADNKTMNEKTKENDEGKEQRKSEAPKTPKHTPRQIMPSKNSHALNSEKNDSQKPIDAEFPQRNIKLIKNDTIKGNNDYSETLAPRNLSEKSTNSIEQIKPTAKKDSSSKTEKTAENANLSDMGKNRVAMNDPVNKRSIQQSESNAGINQLNKRRKILDTDNDKSAAGLALVNEKKENKNQNIKNDKTGNIAEKKRKEIPSQTKYKEEIDKLWKKLGEKPDDMKIITALRKKMNAAKDRQGLKKLNKHLKYREALRKKAY